MASSTSSFATNLVVVLLLVSKMVSCFVVSPEKMKTRVIPAPPSSSTPSSSITSSSMPFSLPFLCSSALWMGKVKRGRLGSIDISEVDGAASTPSEKRQQPKRTAVAAKKATSKRKGGNDITAPISPALSEWASSTVSSPASSLPVDEIVDTTEAAFTTGSKRKKSKPQSARKVIEEQRAAKVSSLVQQLQEKLENRSASDLSEILTIVKAFTKLPSTNLRLLTAGPSAVGGSSKNRRDYRLGWVGSDEAICHIGTGLHKVPLARLEEVFLSFMGRNRIIVQEVIRILGPFPNIRNTLQGNSKILGSTAIDNDAGGIDSATVVEWKVTWDSMIDGTGKELIAGGDAGTREVDLQVLFSDESVVVAVVPPPAQEGSKFSTWDDPLIENGKWVLLFFREPELDEKLEKLRVT